MRKKIVGLLMAVLLCFHFSISFAAGATKTSADFTDLKDLDAATKAKFDAMISAGIFNGVSDSKFGIKEEMNRAQFAKVAALIFGLKVDTDLKTSSFKDVKADDPANGYALPYVEAVKAAGITDGYGNGIYNPAGKVTKEQLATFLVRGLDMNEEAKATPGVNDATVSNWAEGYVALALKLKLLDNGADGKFGGQANATRALLLTGAYEAKGQYVAQVEQVEQKKKEEEEKKKEEEQKKKEEEKPTTDSTSTPNVTTPVQTLATPAANPASGAVVSGTQVSLSATGGATIYYTTDSSTPTRTNGLVYSVPIIVNSAMTVKALAVQNGMRDSEIMSASYTISVQKSPLDLINEASASGEWDNVDEMTFANAGITGVTTSNVSAVKAALDADGTAPWTVSEIQAIVNAVIDDIAKQTALDLINAASASTVWTNVDATTFATAGITGVTTSNVSAVKAALDADGTAPWTVSEIQAIVNAVIDDIAKQTALDLINAASASTVWTNVDATTFATAGITDVTSDNLSAVQYYLETSATPLPRTLAQIQAIVVETIQAIMVDAIYAYLNPYGGGSAPDEEVFNLAGITGVTASNLSDILDALVFAYQDSRSNPFGTPMSSKQDIQDVVDLYLP
ncbi:hypothetical protein PAECIP111893_03631 [Paenibacillus plantiphilus]|uniref:SLH domain-containing protein n=1 Tax=Paenibacillus plantiphilus TaxID=2905650 RepID=A0ABN8GS09_9BACL|nr:chitobiase/beta-hexosaminidase C-terminal domain-containing protein [Paenibacillus plantiphilus]CAH1213109.1 hypothetical protein PAECIP111893_03631 [Paenibacillus plantiphilus]